MVSYTHNRVLINNGSIRMPHIVAAPSVISTTMHCVSKQSSTHHGVYFPLLALVALVARA